MFVLLDTIFIEKWSPQIVKYTANDYTGFLADVKFEGEVKAYEHPKQTYQQPKQTYQQPKQTYQEPEQTYQEPEQTYQEPEQTYQQPEQTYEAGYEGPNQSYYVV